MAGFKRKRNPQSASALVLGPYKAPAQKRRKAFTPGRDRTAGFYGRYSGPQGELKFHDVDLDDAVITAGGQITATINIIPQGVTEVQRIGRKCTLKSINWRYQIGLPEVDAQADPSDSDTVRVIMYLDKQCNGAAAAVTDIMESADYQSFRNLANSGRFQILVDKCHTLNHITLASDNAGVVSQAIMNRDGSFYKKVNIPIEFNSTTGAIGEIRSNNLGVLLLGQSGIAGFNSKIRLRFSDH